MNIEETLKLFDCCWFKMQIFKNQTNPSNPSNSNQNLDKETQENSSEKSDVTSPMFTSPVHVIRSRSDEVSSFFEHPLSPDSVLIQSKLQSILSGKETAEEEQEEAKHSVYLEETVKMKLHQKKRRKVGKKKSLSDLEFEELKGFMDLGFVFTEEDKNSKIAEIIPGLQRFLGGKDGDQENREGEDSSISRPYLSEAWESLDWKRGNKKEIVLDWRIPASSNKMDMKDHLRWWARTVAAAAS